MTKPLFADPHEALRHHVTGAIERGEGRAILELRAASPIRAKVDQADMADTPLFGQGSLL